MTFVFFTGSTERVYPLHFDRLTADDFLLWITHIRGTTDNGFATYSNHRSALNSLFRDFQHDVPSQFKNEVQEYYIGLKRDCNLADSTGVLKITSGKEPMSMSTYRLFSKNMLFCKKRVYIFARTFLIICWNLMCRAGNAESIQFNHMCWNEDHLQIYFAHSKTDQSGDRPRDPRRIYANPISPEICPILALGIYFLCYVPDDLCLFPGRSQYKRFMQVLGQIMKPPNNRGEATDDMDVDEAEIHDQMDTVQRAVTTHLLSLGLQPEDIGSHSIRKGSATFCASGSTHCPSSASLSERAGWANGPIFQTYLRYEAAGDCFVGKLIRYLSGFSWAHEV